MTEEWHYAKGGQREEPVTFERLRELTESGELQPNDLVWRKGMEDWQPAKTVEGLFSEDEAADPGEPGSKQESLAKSPLLAKQFVAAAKSVLLSVLRKIERRRIRKKLLPKAYRALGKRIHSQGTYREDFPDTYRELDDLHNRITELETVSGPTGERLADKAKAAAVTAKQKAEAKALLLKVSRCRSKLGSEAFGRHGKESGPEELVHQIESHLRRSEQLDNEIRELGAKQTSKDGKPISMRKWVAIVCLGAFLVALLLPAIESVREKGREATTSRSTSESASDDSEASGEMAIEIEEEGERSAAKAVPVITEEFLPHVLGTTVFYTVEVFVPGKARKIHRFRAEQQPDGVIQETELLAGSGGQERIVGKSTKHRRIRNGFVEIGHEGKSGMGYCPELKLGAAQGDQWNADGGERFLVTKMYDYEGQPCFVIEKRFVGPMADGPDLEIKNTSHFAKGIGLVEWEGYTSVKGSERWALVAKKTIERPTDGTTPTESLQSEEDERTIQPRPVGSRELDTKIGTAIDTPRWIHQNFNPSLQNVKCFATEDGLVIDFDVDPSKWLVGGNKVGWRLKLFIRLFDRNGNHLTHFTTVEGFTVYRDVYEDAKERYEDGLRMRVPADKNAKFKCELLKTRDNRLIYSVNVRDLRDAAIVEIGFYQER